MRLDRRSFISFTTAAVASAACAEPPAADQVTPEDFGAKGDGVTNDTDAFAAMSDHINRRSGGTIALRRTTYIVGRQLASLGPESWAFRPARIIDVEKLRRPLVIEGNGARLKCAAGLRYGTFNPRTGAPVTRPMPNLKADEIASPYKGMIRIADCSGPIIVRNVELDGNMAQLRIGGPYGDKGRQIPAHGLMLVNNSGLETVSGVHSHYHGLDGLYIDGLVSRPSRSTFSDCVSEYNGRQGLSIVGGRGYDFRRCKFNHTGKSVLMSAPGAGVDIEAEGGKTNRDLSFADCEFAENSGCGMVADSGDSSGVDFTRCLFIGTTNWSAWPNKPGFTFRDCRFVGALVRAATEADPGLRTRFFDCLFTDDPRLSPSGKVYLGSGTFGPIADLNEEGNPIFDSCRFTLVAGAQLPWSIKATYRNCMMTQASTRDGYPRGTYSGRNVIRGAVDLYGSKVVGEVVLNGKTLRNVQL